MTRYKFDPIPIRARLAFELSRRSVSDGLAIPGNDPFHLKNGNNPMSFDNIAEILNISADKAEQLVHYGEVLHERESIRIFNDRIANYRDNGID